MRLDDESFNKRDVCVNFKFLFFKVYIIRDSLYSRLKLEIYLDIIGFYWLKLIVVLKYYYEKECYVWGGICNYICLV